MHDFLWFCSRSNFLNRPTLIFTRLSTSFLENRTVFGGSFFMSGLKNFWHFPATDQIRACHRHVCLCTQIVAKLRKLDFFIGYPQFVHDWDWLEKIYFSWKTLLFLLNVSFKLTTRRAAWRCRKESEGTPSSGWRNGGEGSSGYRRHPCSQATTY